MNISNEQYDKIRAAIAAGSMRSFGHVVKNFTPEARADALREALYAGQLQFAGRVYDKYASVEDRAAQKEMLLNNLPRMRREKLKEAIAWAMERELPVGEVVAELMVHAPDVAAPALLDLGVVEMATPIACEPGRRAPFFMLVFAECDPQVVTELLAPYSPQAVASTFVPTVIDSSVRILLDPIVAKIAEPVTLRVRLKDCRALGRALSCLEACGNLSIIATNAAKVTKQLEILDIRFDSSHRALSRLLMTNPALRLRNEILIRGQLLCAIKERDRAWIELVQSRAEVTADTVVSLLPLLPRHGNEPESARWLAEESPLPLPEPAALLKAGEGMRPFGCGFGPSLPALPLFGQTLPGYLVWLADALARGVAREELAGAYRQYLLGLTAPGAPVPGTPASAAPVRYLANLETRKAAELLALLEELEDGELIDLRCDAPATNGLRRTELVVAPAAAGVVAASLENGPLREMGWDRLLVRA